MSSKEIYSRGVVAVVRGATIDNIITIVEALKSGGVTAIEITMETPNALDIIEKASNECAADSLIGAGTVLDPESARDAIQAGAKFVFSPTVNQKTIEMTKRYDVISVPGAFTPTEILTAYNYGADLVKVFPANVGGPGYFKSLAGPLPHIPLMPTGGIDVHNAADYIQAGAVAVGAGSTLVNAKLALTEEYLKQITDTATQFIQAVNNARSLEKA